MRRVILFSIVFGFLLPVLFGASAQASGGGAEADGEASASAVAASPSSPSSSMSAYRTSGLPVPRFVTLRPDKVYARTGPALRYPVRWVFQKTGLPVEVIQEFDNWRKVRDCDGAEGWVHQSLLSGARGVIVKGDRGGDPLPLRREPEDSAPLSARIEPGTVAHLDLCNDEGWCEIKTQGFEGWIERSLVWGIYPDEKFD